MTETSPASNGVGIRGERPALVPKPASSVFDVTQEEDAAISFRAAILGVDSWILSIASSSLEYEQNNGSLNLYDEARDGRARAQPAGASTTQARRFSGHTGGHHASVKKSKGGCLPPPVAKTYSVDSLFFVEESAGREKADGMSFHKNVK
jgi:hypothetical protein